MNLKKRIVLIAVCSLALIFANGIYYVFRGQFKTMDKINAACRYISENCDKDLTLDSVAESVGFSSCYFSRIFKQTIQRNFVEYLTLQRLKRAQSLLADSDNPITSIAMESGFKSISTFNRVFKSTKKCTPTEFKNMYNRPDGETYTV